MRRLLPLALLLAAVGLLASGSIPCGAFQLQPSCYLAVHPGPIEDTLTMVEVDNERTYASSGQLLLTTVSVDAELDLREWATTFVSREVDRMPRRALFPPGTDEDEVRRANLALMDESQTVAAAAALRYLGYEMDDAPSGAEVAGTLEGLPAEELLEAGDLIVAVDGHEVSSAEDAVELVRHRSPGDEVRLTVISAGAEGGPRELAVRLADDPDDPERGRIGALLRDHIELPVAVEIDAGPIGGPSAGLMFALAVVDLLTPEDLTGGAVVAGTGSVDATGEIGAMGGVRQKLISATERPDRPATVFLVPRPNVEEARSAPLGHRVLVVPVDDLDGAVGALRRVREGNRPPGSFSVGGR
jgi:Lon-like protease